MTEVKKLHVLSENRVKTQAGLKLQAAKAGCPSEYQDATLNTSFSTVLVWKMTLTIADDLY